MTRTLLVLVTDMNPRTNDEELFERSWIGMVRLGLRLFGALCLAVGIYLASGALDNATVVSTAPPVSLLAGTAFLAGFYVERAYETLGITAERILGLTEPDGGERAQRIERGRAVRVACLLRSSSYPATTRSASVVQRLARQGTLRGWTGCHRFRYGRDCRPRILSACPRVR